MRNLGGACLAGAVLGAGGLGALPCGCSPALNGTLSGRVDSKVDADVQGRVVFERALPVTMESTTPVQIDRPVPVALGLGSGPIVVNIQGPQVRYEGVNISDDLLDRVKTDRTTDDWVVAVFGEPTGRATLRDGTEIWKWVYRPVQQEGTVVELFGKSEKEPKLATRAVFLRLRDGVVIEKWKG
jgi:hypothetical protein